MVLNIPDEVMKSAGLTEEEARIGFACWLFQTERLSKYDAAQLCGLTRDEFWAELIKRGIPAIHVTVEQFREDLATLDRLGI